MASGFMPEATFACVRSAVFLQRLYGFCSIEPHAPLLRGQSYRPCGGGSAGAPYPPTYSYHPHSSSLMRYDKSLFFSILLAAYGCFFYSQAHGQVVLDGHAWPVSWVEFSPDGTQVLTASYDSTARLWDATSGALLSTFVGQRGVLTSARFSPDGSRILTLSDEPSLRVWDRNDPSSFITIAVPSRIRDAVFSRDGSVIVGGVWDSTVRIWDVSTGEEQQVLRGNRGDRTYTVRFSPDGTKVLSAGVDSILYLWDVASGEIVHQLIGHGSSVNTVEFSSDGTMAVSAGFDNTAIVWDIVTGDSIHVLRGHSARLRTAVFTPDDRQVVTGAFDNTGRIWDVGTGLSVHILSGHLSRLRDVQVSPNGRLIVTASEDNTAKIWDAASGVELRTLSGHADRLLTARFSPDSRFVATASDDATAQVWDVSSLSTVEENMRMNQGLRLFPNPARTTLSLIWDRGGRASGKGKGVIYDLLGRPMAAFPLSLHPETTIELIPIPAGVYHLEAEDKGLREHVMLFITH